MRFVKKFTQPDFQAKNFTHQVDTNTFFLSCCIYFAQFSAVCRVLGKKLFQLMQFTEHRQNDHYYCTKKEGNIQNPPPQHIALESQSNIFSVFVKLLLFLLVCLYFTFIAILYGEYRFRPPQLLKWLFPLLFVEKVNFQSQIFADRFLCSIPPQKLEENVNSVKKKYSKKSMQIVFALFPAL